MNNYHRQSQINNMNRTTNVTIISKIESECIENRSVVTATSINGNGCDTGATNMMYDDGGGDGGSANSSSRHSPLHTNLDRLNGFAAETVDDSALRDQHDYINNNNIDNDHFRILRRRRSGTWP